MSNEDMIRVAVMKIDDINKAFTFLYPDVDIRIFRKVMCCVKLEHVYWTLCSWNSVEESFTGGILPSTLWRDAFEVYFRDALLEENHYCPHQWTDELVSLTKMAYERVRQINRNKW